MRAHHRSVFPMLVVVSTTFSLSDTHQAEAFSNHVLPSTQTKCSDRSFRHTNCLDMQSPKVQFDEHIRRRHSSSDLKASSIFDFTIKTERTADASRRRKRPLERFSPVNTISQSLKSFLLPVISASLMITGNTVGAGMLVLPEIMQGTGYLSFGILVGAWAMNLISGLTIASVAIQQKEKSGEEVPSSFKEFAEATLPSAASAVSCISIAINILILAFDVFKAGQIGSTLIPMAGDGQLLSYLWASSLALLVSTQSLGTLSHVASFLVIGLFATFASLLLPGIANVSDVASVLTSTPTLAADQLVEGLLQMTPVIITTLVFQNIVPTVTRLLDYDRTKVTTALTIGSVIPLFMYMAWSVSFLGGGIDPSSSLALTGLISCFGLITVAGSSLGTSMSLSEEFEIVFGTPCTQESSKKKDTFSFASVAAPIGISLLVGQLFSNDINDLLVLSGSFGSPMLYGAIPVAMAMMQSQENSWCEVKNENNALGGKSVVPGGTFGLGALGVGSLALVGTELLETMGHSVSMI
ncbi:troptophan/tyrosine permease family protein [Nitzschia inconspicua]|uniref:Troptophan/tyrosine permease family protein n=1 Tax=Nitzschia inconspicua TaxID=303405 RepID=A0A9K3LW16_9STRA|nr:troptophan/tyrosine permease family protein [Nitzschia inconspicua]